MYLIMDLKRVESCLRSLKGRVLGTFCLENRNREVVFITK